MADFQYKVSIIQLMFKKNQYLYEVYVHLDTLERIVTRVRLEYLKQKLVMALVNHVRPGSLQLVLELRIVIVSIFNTIE